MYIKVDNLNKKNGPLIKFIILTSLLLRMSEE
jgi:hypothetical protein